MYNKTSVLIILGILIQNPSIFLDDKYDLNENDFEDRFHKIIFGAISNLFHSGVKTITALELDTYLEKFPVQKKIFDDNNGLAYIEQLLRISRTENFDFHYTTVKKYTLLRHLKSKGIDTSNFINEKEVDPKKTEEQMSRFNSLSINDILDEAERRIIEVKDVFYKRNEDTEQHAGENLLSLIENYKKEPEIGLPMNSNIFNTVCRGARRKKLYLKSCPSGYFKTRMTLADCAKISISYYYDITKSKWIHTRFCEPSLFITTELEVDEILTMLLAYVSCVNESHILDGKYVGDEEERVLQAVKYIEDSQLYIVQLPDFSVDEVERTIRKYHILHKITYCYFDYIFTSMKMLTEIAIKSRGTKLREDNVLLVFIEKLKFLCNELDIHLSTSTQVSDGWQSTKTPDSSLIKACKALAD